MRNDNNNIKVDKTKLVLAHDDSKKLADLPLETKEIGYYKDSWNRFKKNKASLSAFIIILILFFFIIVGPHMKNYDLPYKHRNRALRMAEISPKVPGLEKLGILNGHKKVNKGRRFLTAMYHSEFGKDIIISGFPEELKEDPNHPDYADVSRLTVVVDHYKYANFIASYIPEDYFSTEGGSLATVTHLLTKEEFEEYLAKNYIIDILAYRERAEVYEVRLNYFRYAIDQDPEDTYFWFGTNKEGRDLFTELWRGARVSLLMALAILMINTTIGLTLGSIVGYYGGVLDLIFDRIVEIISSIPFLAVLTLLTLRYGRELWVIVFAFTATGWIGSYGTGRMQFYRFKNREYVLAARTLGASDARIMFKHIFPNTLGYIVTGYALAIPAFIFTEASYSFLGIIDYNKVTSVGMLLKEGQDKMAVSSHLLLFPAMYIATLMIAFNLFGNGLRDAFNPSLRGAE